MAEVFTIPTGVQLTSKLPRQVRRAVARSSPAQCHGNIRVECVQVRHGRLRGLMQHSRRQQQARQPCGPVPTCVSLNLLGPGT